MTVDEPIPNADTPEGPAAIGRRTPPGAPRWVKVFGVIAAVVLVLFLVLLLTGGEHSPGRHFDGGEDPAPGVEHRVPHP